jgi:divalent metal cation (Fe/Co/Zn/Cd) transporter
LRAALKVSYASVVWGAVGGIFAIAVGVQASSTALIGTGTDVLADMVSSVALVWRFRLELHGGRPGHAAERRAHVIAACALLLVAVGVTIGAVIHLTSGEGASTTPAAVAVATAQLAVLPALAVMKRRIAATIGSGALRTDASVTLVGAATAALSLVGLVLTETVHWVSADSVAALGIAALAAVTGVKELAARQR